MSRIKRLALMLAVACLFFTSSHHAFAHGMKTAYLEIVEGAPGIATALWKVPVPGDAVAPSISGCTTVESPELNAEGRASKFIRHITFRCNGALAGREIVVSGLGIEVGEVVVRISLADSAIVSQVIGAANPKWTVPEKAHWTQVFPRYVRFGVSHILSGADHLLFVLGLVLLIGKSRKREIVWTATSFTAAHSITLTATALGWLHIPSVAAEACIAGTLVFLALDIPAAHVAKTASTSRPRSMAFVFGLVHGLGFAGALSEIGLPKGAIVSALFAFNVGVELGQLSFIVAVLLTLEALARLAKRLAPKIEMWSALGGAYAVGTLGVFWLIERWGLLLSS